MSLRRLIFPLVVAVAGSLAVSPVLAQSDAPSQVSAISMEPSEASAAVAIEALPAGSNLVVTAMRPVGEFIELSVETAGHVSITGLRLSATAARATGLAVGTVLVATATSAGVLISAGGEAIAFLPDQLARSLTHHREL